VLFQTLIQAAAKTAPSLSRRSFLRVLQAHGLVEDDERLRSIMTYIKSSDLDLEEKDVEYIRKSSNLIERALNGRLIIPDFVQFTALLSQLYDDTLPNTSGHNADYIPQLANVNPDQFGIAVCTIDGQRFSKGDVSVPFCVQSCSKVITYAIAQTLQGPEKVHQHVGTWNHSMEVLAAGFCRMLLSVVADDGFCLLFFVVGSWFSACVVCVTHPPIHSIPFLRRGTQWPCVQYNVFGRTFSRRRRPIAQTFVAAKFGRTHFTGRSASLLGPSHHDEDSSRDSTQSLHQCGGHHVRQFGPARSQRRRTV